MSHSEMTDPVIPPEAVEAVARQIFFAKHGLDWDFVWFAEEKRAKARQDASEFALIGLQAAFPHLRPLFEVAAQVGLELGRQEAAEEIAAKGDALAEEYQASAVAHRDLSDKTPKGERHMSTAHAFRNKADGAWGVAHIAREVATRTADARTDPSGHTDLPPTPDAAGSKRLPEETA